MVRGCHRPLARVRPGGGYLGCHRPLAVSGQGVDIWRVHGPSVTLWIVTGVPGSFTWGHKGTMEPIGNTISANVFWLREESRYDSTINLDY